MADDINTAFCRQLLKIVHADVRKAFPAIPNLMAACGITQTMRDQYFAEIDIPGRERFTWDGDAYSATEARAKAWQALLRTLEPMT